MDGPSLPLSEPSSSSLHSLSFKSPARVIVVILPHFLIILIPCTVLSHSFQPPCFILDDSMFMYMIVHFVAIHFLEFFYSKTQVVQLASDTQNQILRNLVISYILILPLSTSSLLAHLILLFNTNKCLLKIRHRFLDSNSFPWALTPLIYFF